MNKCIDCGKVISKNSKRCHKCHLKILNQYQTGKNSPSYTHGKSCKDKKCSCGNKISLLATIKLCQKCYYKQRRLNFLKQIKVIYRCIICNKELNKKAKYNKTKLCKSCSTKGKNNPNYVHGKSRFPYPMDFYYIRKIILKRDNFRCKICNNKGNNVHHIDYNKDNCIETNLITLCHKCHMKTNYNRDYWYAYFNYLIGGC